MKVIVAGLSKTGTKSMQAALKDLGYSVYDYMENFEYLGDDWIKICKHGGTTEDFRRMFENVGAVTDMPGCYFWDEIHKAFPDSKIILTMRENEDVWLDSFERQMKKNSSLKSLLSIFLSPTFAKMRYFRKWMIQATVAPGLNSLWYRPFGGIINKTTLRMIYRRHNSHVLQAAPKDKLLVFNVEEGWEPLCQFLGVDVPNKPFPHRNVNGQIIEEFVKTLPLFQRVKREMLVSTSLLTVLFGFGIYKVVKSEKLKIKFDLLNTITSYFKLN